MRRLAVSLSIPVREMHLIREIYPIHSLKIYLIYIREICLFVSVRFARHADETRIRRDALLSYLREIWRGGEMGVRGRKRDQGRGRTEHAEFMCKKGEGGMR
jgi:hypothetical protein